jgi:hypothetical protein
MGAGPGPTADGEGDLRTDPVAGDEGDAVVGRPDCYTGGTGSRGLPLKLIPRPLWGRAAC